VDSGSFSGCPVLRRAFGLFGSEDGRPVSSATGFYSDEDIIRRVAIPKIVLCVSWNPSLASTRERLLAQAGYRVISALGEEETASRCRTKADLLVLGHSVPRDKKEAVIKCFREHSQAPILSPLRPVKTSYLRQTLQSRPSILPTLSEQYKPFWPGTANSSTDSKPYMSNSHK
jgi:hypothetical protein